MNLTSGREPSSSSSSSSRTEITAVEVEKTQFGYARVMYSSVM